MKTISLFFGAIKIISLVLFLLTVNFFYNKILQLKHNKKQKQLRSKQNVEPVKAVN